MTANFLRLTVYFSGHVQGVGFRYTAHNIARTYPVGGYVQNLDDGRVLLVVEGAEKDVVALVEDVVQRMRQFIRDHAVSRAPATGEFAGVFRIAH